MLFTHICSLTGIKISQEHQDRIWEKGQICSFLRPLPRQRGCVTFAAPMCDKTQSSANQAGSPHLCVQRCYWGSLYLHDWLTALSLQANWYPMTQSPDFKSHCYYLAGPRHPGKQQLHPRSQEQKARHTYIFFTTSYSNDIKNWSFMWPIVEMEFKLILHWNRSIRL